MTSAAIAAMKIETNGGTTIVIGAIISAVLGLVGALFKLIFGRKKADAEAETSVVGTAMMMIGRLETERARQAEEINECHRDYQKLQRRNMLLERMLTRAGIDVPPEDGASA